jgi:hypothetical protein
LPPAAVDGRLRHAQVGSQLIHGQEPAPAARGSRVPGGPAPVRWTLRCARTVKSAAGPGPGHGSFGPRFGLEICGARADEGIAMLASRPPVAGFRGIGRPLPIKSGLPSGFSRPARSAFSVDCYRSVRGSGGGQPDLPGAGHAGLPRAITWRDAGPWSRRARSRRSARPEWI